MIVCKKQTTDLQQGIQNLIDTMVEDYATWAKNMDWDDSTTLKFADKIRTTEGKKYIKIISDNSCTAENDEVEFHSFDMWHDFF